MITLITAIRRCMPCLLLGLVLALPSLALAEPDTRIYTLVPASDKAPGPGQFQAFDSTNIPACQIQAEVSFRAQILYSARDWEFAQASPERTRIPRDSSRLEHLVLEHKTLPLSVSITFEKVEAPNDSDPLTLTKILRYSREANSKFHVLREETRSVSGVEGMESEYVELVEGQLFHIRHWITHVNGTVYQLQLLAPYDHSELLQIGGSSGYPVALELLDKTRTRPLVKDADVSRTFDSPNGFHVNLGEGDWIPGVFDSYIPYADYVAYTRNQGGIAIMSLGTFGQNLETPVLLRAMASVGGLLPGRAGFAPQPVSHGGLEGLGFNTTRGKEEVIRTHVKLVRNSGHAYLLAAWINTNSATPPEMLEQWLNKITFTPQSVAYPSNVSAFQTFREKNLHATTFLELGDYYLGKNDFDRSAKALRTALECRFLPEILGDFMEADLARGHPEETLAFLKDRGPLALKQPWVAMNLAYTESRLGQYDKAAIDYTRCISSGHYAAESFPARRFEDYVRCLAKLGRTQWAKDRLQQRLRRDDSPIWTQMLEQLTQNALPGPEAPSALAGSVEPVASVSQSPPVAATSTNTPTPLPAAETGIPTLQAIMWNARRPGAQLGGKLLFEGESLRGYKLQKIRQDAVDLITPDGGSRTLKLKQ